MFGGLLTSSVNGIVNMQSTISATNLTTVNTFIVRMEYVYLAVLNACLLRVYLHTNNMTGVF
jgi:hypothetical protein